MNSQYLVVLRYLSHTVYCLYKIQYRPALLVTVIKVPQVQEKLCIQIHQYVTFGVSSYTCVATFSLILNCHGKLWHEKTDTQMDTDYDLGV